MRTQPLVHTLQALSEEEHQRRFRCLAEPLWVANMPLDLNVAHRRLHEHVEGEPTFFYCPVRQCRKVYQMRSWLNKHLCKHPEFRRLTARDRDQVLHELAFKLPPDSGLRGSLVSADDGDANATVFRAGQKRPR